MSDVDLQAAKGDGQVWVFIGPTLRSAEVREILPRAQVRPPIAAEDLWNLPIQPADTVAIIDGLFAQCRSIRHKELIDLLDRGVRVVGAASMGALRAVELAPVGMVGVGTVVQWYRDGVIDADDEVAVVHRDASQEYQQVSRALVDLRASMAEAIDRGLIAESSAEAILTFIAAMPFTHRDDVTIGAGLAERLGAAVAADYSRVVQTCWVDVKAADARMLLAAIAADALPPPVVDLPEHELQSNTSTISLFQDWRITECAELGPAGNRILGWQVLAAARIFDHDLPAMLTRAAIDAAWSDATGELDVDAAVDPEGSLTWLVDLLIRRGVIDGPDDVDALTKPLLRADEANTFEDGARLRAFLRRTHAAPWRVGDLSRVLRAHGRWDHWRAAADRVLAFNARIRARRPSFNHYAIPEDQMRQWCAERWLGVSDPDPREWWLAITDRGYSSVSRWRADARWVFPFAKLGPLGECEGKAS